MRKALSILVLACFTVSFVLGDALSAVAGPAPAKALFEGHFIPPSVGRIVGGGYFGTDTVILVVQDLHCHPEVQKNIAHILSAVEKKYGLSRVYLEGTSGDVDTSWLLSIDDERMRERVLDGLMNSGRLTGAEYYSVRSGHPRIIEGIENDALYSFNFRLLGKILGGQEAARGALSDIGRDIDALKNRYFNERHRKLELLAGDYERGDIDARRYFRSLGKTAAALAMDLDEYRAVSLFLDLLEREERLRYRGVARQLNEFLVFLKHALPYAAYQSLLKETDNFTRPDAVYAALARVAGQYRPQLDARFDALKRFFDYVEENRRMNPLELVREERALVAAMRYAFSENESQREVVFLSDYFGFLDKFIDNRASYDEYVTVTSRWDAFRRLWEKYIDDDRLASLEPQLELLRAFYRANVARNGWFVRAVAGDIVPPREGNAAEGSNAADEIRQTLQSLAVAREIRAVVTGGFHTAGLEELLAKKGVSYLVITPNVTGGIDRSDAVYARLAREQARLPEQAFALRALSEEPGHVKAREAAFAIMKDYVNSKLPREEIVRLLKEFLRRNKYSIDVDMGDEAGGGYPVEVRYEDKEGNEQRSHFVYVVAGGEVTPASERDGDEAEISSPGPASVFDGFARRFLGERPASYAFYTVVLASLWETLAFPLLGAQGMGIWWATFGFAFAHAVVRWVVRATERGKEGGVKAALSPVLLLQDIEAFAVRSVLSFFLFSPYLILDQISASVVSALAHSAYNLAAMTGRLPSWLPLMAIARKKDHRDDASRFDPSILAQVRDLGITDDPYGDTIFGMKIKDWIGNHAPTPGDPYAAQRRRRDVSNLWKRSAPEIRKDLRAFYQRINAVDSGRRDMNGRHTKRSLYPLILWKVNWPERNAKKFFDGLAGGGPLVKLPIFPVDSDGRLRKDLMRWMKNNYELPPVDYLVAKKVPLREILPEAVQLPLFADGPGTERKKLSIHARAGMMVFGGAVSGLFWAAGSLLFGTSLGLLAGVPLVAYYAVTGFFLIAAAWKQTAGKGVLARASVVLWRIFSGDIVPAWTSGGRLRTDRALFGQLAGPFQDIALRHERRHLAFAREHPALNRMPFIPEVEAALGEIIALGGFLFRRNGAAGAEAGSGIDGNNEDVSRDTEPPVDGLPFLGAAGNIIFAGGLPRPQAGAVRETVERHLKLAPKEIIDNLHPNLMKRGLSFTVAYDPSLNESGVSLEGNAVTVALGRDVIYGPGQVESVTLHELLSEAVAALLLPDYQLLKERMKTNENAFFKLELVKALLMSGLYISRYHKLVSRARGEWTAENFWEAKTRPERDDLFFRYRRDLERYLGSSERLAQRHVAANIFEEADPLFVVTDYIHLLFAHSDPDDGDIARMIAAVARIDAGRLLSVAHLRNAAKEFFFGGKAVSPREGTAAAKERFDRFDDTVYLSRLWDTLLVSRERTEFYTAYRALVRYLLPPLDEERVNREVTRFFDRAVFETEDREPALAAALKDMLGRRIGRRAVRYLEGRLPSAVFRPPGERQETAWKEAPFMGVLFDELDEGQGAEEFGRGERRDDMRQLFLHPGEEAEVRTQFPPALGFSREELTAIALEHLFNANALLFPVEDSQAMARTIVDALVAGAGIHRTGLRLLLPRHARKYRPQSRHLRREILRHGDLLKKLGVTPKKENVRVVTVKGELMPVGADGADLGYATVRVAEGKITFHVTEGFWKNSQGRAPPRLLELLAGHELRETLFLRDTTLKTYHDFHALTQDEFGDLYAFARHGITKTMIAASIAPFASSLSRARLSGAWTTGMQGAGPGDFVLELIRQARRSGHSAVEIYPDDFLSPLGDPDLFYGKLMLLLEQGEEIRSLARAYGIDIVLHAPALSFKDARGVARYPDPATDRKFFMELLSLGAYLGCRVMTVHLDDPGNGESLKGYAELVREAAQWGITIAVENDLYNPRHGADLARFSGKGAYHTWEEFTGALVEIAGQLSPAEREHLGITFDVPKVLFAPDPAAGQPSTDVMVYYDKIKQLERTHGIRIVNVHLAQIRREKYEKRPLPEEGAVPVLALLQLLERDGYRGYVNQELNGEIIPPSFAEIQGKPARHKNRFVRPIVVTIDGPSGGGKSETARMIADRLNAVYFSYGGIFRLITRLALEKGIQPSTAAAEPGQRAVLIEIARGIDLRKFHTRTVDGKERDFYGNRDVTEIFLAEDVAVNVYHVSAVPEVRQIATEMMVAYVSGKRDQGISVILDGRVTGTEIAPDADVKIFMTSSVESRADRRAAQMIGEFGLRELFGRMFGVATASIEGRSAADLRKQIADKVREDIEERDRRDREREYSPALRADDAVELEVSGKSVHEMADTIGKIVQATVRKKPRAAAVLGDNVAPLLRSFYGVDVLEGASVDTVELLIDIFRASPVGERAYREHLEMFQGEAAATAGIKPGRVEIKVGGDAGLIRGDARALATMEWDGKAGKVTIYVHRVFLDGLRNRAPSECRQMLRDLALHEMCGYRALNYSKEGKEIYHAFGRFLVRHGLSARTDRNADNFQRYIEYLAAAGELSPVERKLKRELAGQASLFAFARRRSAMYLLERLLTDADGRPQKGAADAVIVCGNDDLGTFRETLRLYAEGSAGKIVLTGGRGRLFEPLVREAAAHGYRLDIDEKTSEAGIIGQILLQMAEEEGIPLDPRDLLREERSTNTRENFEFAKELLGAFAREAGKEAVSVIYIQTPLQQFRTKATFNRVFENELAAGLIKGISHTTLPAPENDERSRALDLLREMWRLVLYSAKGDLTVESGGKTGPGALPVDYWRAVESLAGEFSGAKTELRRLAGGVKNADGAPLFETADALLSKLDEDARSAVDGLVRWVFEKDDAADELDRERVAQTEEKYFGAVETAPSGSGEEGSIRADYAVVMVLAALGLGGLVLSAESAGLSALPLPHDGAFEAFIRQAAGNQFLSLLVAAPLGAAALFARRLARYGEKRLFPRRYYQRRLASADEGVRADAAAEMGERRDERFIGTLVALLSDGKAAVRREAARALAAYPGGRLPNGAVDPLIALLMNDPDEGVRAAAALALGAFGGVRAGGALIEAMSDASPHVRLSIMSALRDIPKDRDGMEGIRTILTMPLVRLLTRGDVAEYEKRAAARTLAAAGDRRTPGLLIGLLEDERQYHIHRIVAEALGERGDKRALAPFLRSLTYPYAAGYMTDDFVEKVLERLGASVDDEIAAYRALLARLPAGDPSSSGEASPGQWYKREPAPERRRAKMEAKLVLLEAKKAKEKARRERSGRESDGAPETAAERPLSPSVFDREIANRRDILEKLGMEADEATLNDTPRFTRAVYLGMMRKALLETISPANPFALAARAGGAPRTEEERWLLKKAPSLHRRTVIEIFENRAEGERLDMLAALQRFGVAAFGIVVSERKPEHAVRIMPNVHVPGLRAGKDPAKIEVYAESRPVEGRDVILFHLYCPPQEAAEGLPEEERVFIRHRAALWFLFQLREDGTIARELGGQVSPAVVGLSGRGVVACPAFAADALREEFEGTLFVYTRADMPERVSEKMLRAAPGGTRLPDVSTDVNRLGELLADAVTGDAPEEKGRRSGGTVRERLEGLIEGIYGPGVARKQGEGRISAFPNRAQVLLTQALRGERPGSDPGIGKVTNWAAFLRDIGGKTGENALISLPLTDPRSSNRMAGDVLLIDWEQVIGELASDGVMSEEEARPLLDGLRVRPEEGDRVDRAGVRAREYRVAEAVYAKLGDRQRKELERFSAENSGWLESYAGDLSGERKAVTFMMQWFFARQVRRALGDVHRQKGKVLFTVRCEGNYRKEIVDAVRYWYALGFDGIQVKVRGSVSDREGFGRFLDEVKGVSMRAGVEAVVIVHGEDEADIGDMVRGREFVFVRGEGATPERGDGVIVPTADTIESFEMNAKKAVESGASWLLSNIGFSWGEDVDLERQEEIAGEVDRNYGERYGYRVPAAGSERRRLGGEVAAVSGKIYRRTRDGYEAGYARGLRLFGDNDIRNVRRKLIRDEKNLATLYDLVKAYETLRLMKGQGEIGDSYRGGAFLERAAHALRPVLNEREWLRVNGGLARVRRNFGPGTTAEERIAANEQLFGFIRGLLERVVEAEDGIRLPENEVERKALRSLLLAARIAGVNVRESGAAVAAPRRRGTYNGENADDIVAMLRYVGDLGNGRERGYLAVSEKMKEAMRPYIGLVMKTGTLPDSLLGGWTGTEEFPEVREWAVTEFLRLYDVLFNDRGLSGDRLEEIIGGSKISVELLRKIFTAA